MRVRVPQVALASYLESDNGTYVRARAAGGANPTGFIARPTRAQFSFSGEAGPRDMHPMLNTVPWSTSMAVYRTEPREVRKGRRKGGKRQ